MRAPLGISRIIRTRLASVEDDREIVGEAGVDRAGEHPEASTTATLRWTLVDCGRATEVTLAAVVWAPRRRDRLLLVCGRRWLEARFAGVLAELERVMAG